MIPMVYPTEGYSLQAGSEDALPILSDDEDHVSVPDQRARPDDVLSSDGDDEADLEEQPKKQLGRSLHNQEVMTIQSLTLGAVNGSAGSQVSFLTF